MSGEILQFPGSRLIEAERDRFRADEFQKRRRLVQTVRSAKQFRKANDVIWPAQKISELRERARRELKSANVANALRRNGCDPKHWERLSIDHTLSYSEAVRQCDARYDFRKDPLAKSVQKYVALLDALADLIVLDRDDVICDAFKNTTFSGIEDTSDLTSAQQLTWYLNELAKALIKAEKLDEYYASPLIFLSCMAWEDGFSTVWDAPPNAPSFPLLRVPRGHLNGPLNIETAVVAPPHSTVEAASERMDRFWGWGNEAFGPSVIHNAELKLFADVRIVLAPRKTSSGVTAWFEVRPVVMLIADGQERALTVPNCATLLGTQFDPVGTVAAKFKDGWHRITGIQRETWSGDLQIGDWYGGCLGGELEVLCPFLEYEGNEFVAYWVPVDLQHVRQLLEMSPRLPWKGQNLVQRDGPHGKPAAIWLHEWPELQVALYSGAIETHLVNDCQRLWAKLKAAEKKREATLAEERLAMLARWQKLTERNG